MARSSLITLRRAGYGALAAAGAVAAPTSGLTQGWTVEASLFERVETESNRSLGGEPDGAVFGGAAGVSVTASTESESGGVDLSSFVGGDYFTGPGAVDESVRVDSGLSADLVRRFGRSTVTFGGDVTARPTSVTQFDDSGQTDDGSSEVAVGLDGSLSHRIDERHRVTVSADGDTRRFFDGDTDLRATNQVSGEASWGYALTPLTETSAGVGVTGQEINDENVERISYDAFAGLSGRVTDVLSFDVRGGASFAETSREGFADTDDVSFNGRFGLTYRAPMLTTSVLASQSVEPSSIGEFQNQSRVTFNLIYDLTEQSQVSLQTGYAFQTSADGFADNDTERQSVRVSPAYQLDLSERWDMSLGYNFKLSDTEQEDVETSHGVFLELRQNFYIFP